MRSFYIMSIVLLLVFSCLFAGCTQLNQAPVKKIQNSSRVLNPIPVSGQVIIKKPGLYQLTSDQSPSGWNESTIEYSFINIRSSNVIFDGMGHVINGTNIKTKCFQLNSEICEQSDGINIASSTDNPTPFSNIVIRNVTVTNWKTGINLNHEKDILVENSVLTVNDCGLQSVFSSNITLIQNSILNNYGSGIDGIDNDKFTISENLIAHNKNMAIDLDGHSISTPVHISVPASLQFLFGPWIILGQFGTSNKKMTTNEGHTIYGNEINDNDAGIVLDDYVDNNIQQNNIHDNRGYGLWLDKIDNTTVENNTILNSSDKGYDNYQVTGTSIFLENCGPDVHFINNTLIGGTVDKESFPEDTVPITLIVGPVLVFLLNILAGASKVIGEYLVDFEPPRLFRWITARFNSTVERIRSVTQYVRISVLFEGMTPVSLFGAIILGGVFTYSTSFGLKVNVFLILTIMAGIVIIIPKVVQYLVAERIGMEAGYHMWWGGILVMLLTTVLLGSPFGQPVRTEIIHKEPMDKKKLAITLVAGQIVTLLLIPVFLLLYLVKGTFASYALIGLEMSLLIAVVSFLPFSPMEGEQVYKWNKIVWALLFLPVIIGYGYFLVAF